jgi:hypothetical protein
MHIIEISYGDRDEIRTRVCRSAGPIYKEILRNNLSLTWGCAEILGSWLALIGQLLHRWYDPSIYLSPYYLHLYSDNHREQYCIVGGDLMQFFHM